MKSICPIVLLVLLALAPLAASAHSRTKTGVTTSPEYVLGVDDVIEVSDANHANLDKTLTILPDGSITYPEVGRVKAAGKTPEQLAGDIGAALEETHNNVAVTVIVKEVHSQRVRLVGSVKNPGAYDFKRGWRVLDLVAMAGGLTARPARITGRIVRGAGQVIPLNLGRATMAPEADSNPTLQADDLVFLEEADPEKNKVYVMGQVTKPGAYDLGDGGINLLSLISQAGNTTPTAALTRAYIQRDATQIPLNLRPILVDGRMDDNARTFTLQAGDVLFIPEIESRVAVMGQVNNPGYYPLPETRPLTVLDALSLAGGQGREGDLGKAGIIRVVNGKASVVPINIDQMLQKKNLNANVALLPNDVLFIPARGEKRFEWRDVLYPLSILSGFGLRVF